MNKEERLKDLTEQVYAILSEEPTMDVAARQLADIYLNLMKRLLFKFGPYREKEK